MAYSVAGTVNYKDGRERSIDCRYETQDALEVDLHQILHNLKVSSIVITIVRTKRD